MVKDIQSFNAQVEIEPVLLIKTRALFFSLCLFITSLFSAQQADTSKNTAPEPLISVVGDAVIYSKDPAFNAQMRNNKNLQLNSKIEVAANSDLKISAKSTAKKAKLNNPSKKKKENIVVAAKEEKEKKYKSNLPKKEVKIKIDSKDVSAAFSSGFSTCQVSFVPPNNDSSLSKFVVGQHLFQERASVKFPTKINYYYKNRNLKQQISIYKLSVRPPPAMIL
ncbi:hypothetical protein LUD75_00280 [Epilithonimonas sp. JDS]|uniref:hypothetical protein n=1 Tax=Epilithonimonas sp. JDS TaxID=2902797 RepID=UPI001E3DDF0C|nr:hypothetical protein [Epilithonimonas sp. JDS]MCD9853124.1 hypothetical protein [Epilithonimonas sp. JDS]